MRTRMGLLVVGAVLAGLVAPQASLAQASGAQDVRIIRTVPTNLTVARGTASFAGTANSIEPGCRDRRGVTLIRRYKGTEEVIGTGATNELGRWLVEARFAGGTYVARVAPSEAVDERREDVLSCLGDISGVVNGRTDVSKAGSRRGGGPAVGDGSAGVTSTSCLRYGDVVTFQFSRNGRFMTAEDSGAVTINRTQPAQWERFLLVDPSNLANDGTIPGGGLVALRTYKHNNYLQRESSGLVRADSRVLVADSRWKFSATGPCILLAGSGSGTEFLLTPNGAGVVEPGAGPGYQAVTEPAPVPPGSDLVVTRVSWTDFYYDVPWQSHASTGQQCPYRGRWDGANCFIAASMYPQPFVWHDNFYGDSSSCAVLGWFDGAHCQIGVNPPYSHTPFVYLTNSYSWYLGSGPSAAMQCTTASKARNVGDLYACGKNGAIQLGIFPMDPTYNTNGGLLAKTAIPLPNISHYRVCYKKKPSLTPICNNQHTYSGSNIRDFTGLQSNKKYKFRVFYTVIGSPEIKVGKLVDKTL